MCIVIDLGGLSPSVYTKEPDIRFKIFSDYFDLQESTPSTYLSDQLKPTENVEAGLSATDISERIAALLEENILNAGRGLPTPEHLELLSKKTLRYFKKTCGDITEKPRLLFIGYYLFEAALSVIQLRPFVPLSIKVKNLDDCGLVEKIRDRNILFFERWVLLHQYRYYKAKRDIFECRQELQVQGCTEYYYIDHGSLCYGICEPKNGSLSFICSYLRAKRALKSFMSEEAFKQLIDDLSKFKLNSEEEKILLLLTKLHEAMCRRDAVAHQVSRLCNPLITNRDLGMPSTLPAQEASKSLIQMLAIVSLAKCETEKTIFNEYGASVDQIGAYIKSQLDFEKKFYEKLVSDHLAEKNAHDLFYKKLFIWIQDLLSISGKKTIASVRRSKPLNAFLSKEGKICFTPVDPSRYSSLWDALIKERTQKEHWIDSAWQTSKLKKVISKVEDVTIGTRVKNRSRKKSSKKLRDEFTPITSSSVSKAKPTVTNKVAPSATSVKRSKKDFAYAPRVARWFFTDEKYNPCLIDPGYALDPEKDRAKIDDMVRRHSFAKVLDDILAEEGIENKKGDRMLVGEMDIDGKSTKYVFTYAFTKDSKSGRKLCYHRFAHALKSEDITEQFIKDGYFTLDYPLLTEETSASVTIDTEDMHDGSKIILKNDTLITVQDSRNKVVIRVCRKKALLGDMPIV